MVFADQPAYDAPALDPGGEVDDVADPVQRRVLLQPLVWPVPVVVPCVLGQNLAEMPLAEDQHLVQAPAAKRSNEPLRK